MNFHPDSVSACSDHGIDIEQSYAHMLLEVRFGGPSLDRLLAAVARPNAKTRAAATHGTESCYRTRRCRCQWCRAAEADAQRRRRDARKHAA